VSRGGDVAEGLRDVARTTLTAALTVVVGRGLLRDTATTRGDGLTAGDRVGSTRDTTLSGDILGVLVSIGRIAQTSEDGTAVAAGGAGDVLVLVAVSRNAARTKLAAGTRLNTVALAVVEVGETGLSDVDEVVRSYDELVMRC
jgi:hypothetical protein